MAIPPIVFLAIYGVFLLLATLYTFFNVFHLVKFGIHGTKTQILIAAYCIGYLLVVSATITLLFAYDWSSPIVILQNASRINLL